MLEVQETPLGHEILNDNFYILFVKYLTLIGMGDEIHPHLDF